jgi:hypothetical protein
MSAPVFLIYGCEKRLPYFRDNSSMLIAEAIPVLFSAMARLSRTRWSSRTEGLHNSPYIMVIMEDYRTQAIL